VPFACLMMPSSFRPETCSDADQMVLFCTGEPFHPLSRASKKKPQREMKKKGTFAEDTDEVATMARARGHAVTAHDEGSLVIYGFPTWENLNGAERRRVQLAKDCRGFRNKPEEQWTSDQFLLYHELSRTSPHFVVTDTMLVVYAMHLQ
jgi:hypothetical protein